MPEPTPLLPTDPESIGGYRLQGRLGIGGQGTVYLGRDERGRRAAIKLLHPHLITHERARDRFLAEVDIAKRVAPFCTAQVLDSGVINDQPYIVSEFVDGPSLLASVKEGDGTRGKGALQRLAINTVNALAAIHKGGVVHRDFKPGNVLLGPEGPVVIDFGISRALDLSQSLTSSQVVGTPGYMAPEHIDGEKAGPAADMFAWAATMVFAATGRRAFPGDTVSAVALAVLHKEPELDGLEGDLAEIVRACLEKDPAERPTASEVGDRLRALKTPPEPEKPQAAPESPQAAPEDPQPAPDEIEPRRVAPRRGHKRRGLVLAVVALMLLASTGVYLWPAEEEKGRATPPPSNFVPTASETPTASPSKKEPSKSPGPTESKAPRASQKPDPGRTASKSEPPPEHHSPKKPSNPKPRTLGSLTAQDYGNYCRAHGYPYSAVFADQAVCSKDREGNNGTIASPTAVCQWRHSGQPNVRANGRTCVSNP